MRQLTKICVFCGSADGLDPAISDLAFELGTALAARSIGLVYGGARVGLMGKMADAVLAGGGEVTGVLPKGLFSREVPHESLTELLVVDGMHERKATMYALADGFIAIPGGFGTLDELFEAATWNQLKLHAPRKPISVLDTDGFWDLLFTMVDHMTGTGFVRSGARAMLQHAKSIDEAFDQLCHFEFDA